MTTPEPPLSAPSASSQALPADQAHPAVLPPVETLRAARQWATEHRHQQPDDRMLAIVYAAGVAAGRTAAAADLAATFRSAAIHRREYMGVGEQRHDELLSIEAVTLESAAEVADGDLGPLYAWLPSWRWTDEMNARLNARLDAKDPADG